METKDLVPRGGQSDTLAAPGDQIVISSPSPRLKRAPQQLAPPRPECCTFFTDSIHWWFQKEVPAYCPGQALTGARPTLEPGLDKEEASDEGPLTGSTLRPMALLHSVGHPPLCADWS